MSDSLMDAVLAKDFDRLAKLLAEGEDPNQSFEPRYTFSLLDGALEWLPMCESEEGGSEKGGFEADRAMDAVVLLLRYGADVNAWHEAHMTSPIMTAAQHHHLEAMRLLLARGADPNVRDEEGETPLRLFTKSGSLEMVRLLLQCGADMYRAGGGDGMNPISLAARALDIDMLRLYLAHGADPNVPDLDRLTVFDRLRWFPPSARPETPQKWERFQEVRRLLGAPPLVPEEP